jgi:hypothetical protein
MSSELENNINLPVIKTSKKSSNKKSGRLFSEIWKTDMIREEPKGDNYYSGHVSIVLLTGKEQNQFF